eukprot:2967279-Amphidinium_carterae.1
MLESLKRLWEHSDWAKNAPRPEASSIHAWLEIAHLLGAGWKTKIAEYEKLPVHTMDPPDAGIDHDLREAVDATPSPFECEQCQRNFLSLTALRAHNRAKHNTESLIGRRVGWGNCLCCHGNFGVRSNLLLHYHKNLKCALHLAAHGKELTDEELKVARAFKRSQAARPNPPKTGRKKMGLSQAVNLLELGELEGVGAAT